MAMRAPWRARTSAWTEIVAQVRFIKQHLVHAQLRKHNGVSLVESCVTRPKSWDE
jgi:hypothetical protein